MSWNWKGSSPGVCWKPLRSAEPSLFLRQRDKSHYVPFHHIFSSKTTKIVMFPNIGHHFYETLSLNNCEYLIAATWKPLTSPTSSTPELPLVPGHEPYQIPVELRGAPEWHRDRHGFPRLLHQLETSGANSAKLVLAIHDMIPSLKKLGYENWILTENGEMVRKTR